MEFAKIQFIQYYLHLGKHSNSILLLYIHICDHIFNQNILAHLLNINRETLARFSIASERTVNKTRFTHKSLLL